MFEFKMPKLGADMDEGTLLEWKISPGDHVNKGDVVAVVETSKGAIDIEAFVDGEVDSLLVKPDALVPVGAAMATFHLSDEKLPPPTPTSQSADRNGPSLVMSSAPTPTTPARQTRSTSVSTGKQVSPRARRMASRLKVDLSNIRGTGPGGSIVAEDVQAAADSGEGMSPLARKPDRQPVTSKTTAARTTAMRSTIAAAMSRSKREIPHYYLGHDVDVSALITFVETWNENHGVADRILPALLFYKAIGVAAAEFPSMNGFYAADPDAEKAFLPSPVVNLGIAISLRGGGLVAPCLKDVANRPALQLMGELKDLVARTRGGGLRASEMSEGTLTVSNLGDRGVDFLAGVIYPPQVALVGIGSLRKRTWVVDDNIAVRPVINLSLAADHRVSDGHTGALFLRRIEAWMSEPEKLM